MNSNCTNSFSGANFIGLASSLSILLSENLSPEELNILAAFFTALGDNLALISAAQSSQDSGKQNTDCQFL